MNHYILKLSTGEFVYGVINLEKADKKMIIVENPLTWEEYESADGTVGSALIKYMVGTSETDIPIAASSIISMAQMSPEFENFYEAAVACQQITDQAYNEKIQYMTARMVGLVMEYQAKTEAEKLGEDAIVAFDKGITFH